MKIEVGAYEAKTQLPKLLRQVQAGHCFTITSRGKAVADLVPSSGPRVKNPSMAIDHFLAFIKAHPVRAKVDIKALIEDGRE